MAIKKTLRLLLALAVGALSPVLLVAQGDATGELSTPKDMFEVGVGGGHLFVAGDVTFKPGYAYGLHIRKATDYVFSLRLDAMMGKAMGENPTTNIAREFEMDWFSVTGLGVFTLNNFRFDRASRKINYYAMAGAGANSFMTEFKSAGTDGNPRFGTIEAGWAPHATVGAGLAFRLGKKVNIALEHQASSLFGQRSDELDGITKEDGVRSVGTDLINYTSLQINFNIGNASNRSEPLYWCNPLESMIADMQSTKRRVDEALVDSDGDGVIDAIDQEPNTPTDAPVDTKGRTLDSDKDGVADYLDKEPYYPPRAGERVNADGVVVNPITPAGAGGGVTEARVQEMIDQALARYGITEERRTVADFFLPMIHFSTDGAVIKYSDYGTLASIGRMMKNDETMRLVITGHTDQTGGENYNDALSYQRALAVIDHLVNQHGIGRGRLVLQWKGSKEALVPSATSYMNRRVEFSVASSSDVEMDPPAGASRSGSTDGY